MKDKCQHGFVSNCPYHKQVVFNQTIQIIECGGCHPKKYEDCKSLERQYNVICDCQCHAKSREEKAIDVLLKELDTLVFTESTTEDLTTGEWKEEKLNPLIQDREGTIYIKGEWDREDFKSVIRKVFEL